MELKTAIERVERFATAITWANDDDRQALALVLAAAKRPGFTVEEMKRLARIVDSYWSYTGATSRQYEEELRATLAAKLDAYLEGLKGQSE